MKLLVLSDLHLEFEAPLCVPPDISFDVVVLAGDIHCPGHKAVEWAKDHEGFRDLPVVVVPGNHEFYGSVMGEERQRMREAAEGSNVYLLDKGVTVIAGVRFIGCMLWTDFQLKVRQPDGGMAFNVERAIAQAASSLNDFRLIEISAVMRTEYRERLRPRLLCAEDTLAMHWVERDWLRRTLADPFDGPTVVVTHHAPAAGSVAPRYASDWLTPAFVSHLPEELFEVPALWVHGHTHTSFDYRRQGCRIVSNPRGYPGTNEGFENSAFNVDFVVEIPDNSAPTQN